jgi:hypothetical protein
VGLQKIPAFVLKRNKKAKYIQSLLLKKKNVVLSSQTELPVQFFAVTLFRNISLILEKL